MHPSLVSTSWLAEHINDAELAVLDGSFKLPGATPTARDEFLSAHLPGAQFFDVDDVADHSNKLPHMLPSEQQFAVLIGAMGIGNETLVVVYDRPGMMSAGRVWWTLRAFGHQNVKVLNGGFKKWVAEGRQVTADLEVPEKRIYQPKFDAAAVRDRRQMLANISSAAEQVIDARSAARFSAEEKEARPGLRSGHIPGSLNLPFNLLSDPATGEVKSPEEIKALFEKAGLDLRAPVIATCGSGVTAAALAFGLHLIGKSDVAVYDGAWAEWGLPGDTPVVP